MTEINGKTLYKNGWASLGYCNGREFFSKGDYIILEHMGKFGPPAHRGALYSDKTFNTIEELETNAYKFYVKRLKSLENQMNKVKEQIIKFKNYE